MKTALVTSSTYEGHDTGPVLILYRVDQFPFSCVLPVFVYINSIHTKTPHM